MQGTPAVVAAFCTAATVGLLDPVVECRDGNNTAILEEVGCALLP